MGESPLVSLRPDAVRQITRPQLEASEPPVVSVNAELSMAHGARCPAKQASAGGTRLRHAKVRRWLECTVGRQLITALDVCDSIKALCFGRLELGVHGSTLRRQADVQRARDY